MRVTSISIPIIILGAGSWVLSACGSDSTTDGGGGNPDATCGAVHNPCPDSGLPPGTDAGDVVSVTDPEGGGMLFEYITFDNTIAGLKGLPAGVTTVTRVVAHFIETSMPADAPLPTPGQCVDLAVTKGWPEYAPTMRTELDVGTVTVMGKNNADMDKMISVPKAMAGAPMTYPKDDLGRPHDIFYQLITPDAAAQQKPGSFYSVALGGAGNIAPYTFNNVMYLAKHFDVMEPGLNDTPTLHANADFTVKWSVTANPDLPTNNTAFINLISLVDPATGGLVVICPVDPASGMFTIPKEMIASYRSSVMANGNNPDQMVMLRNNITHHFVRLPNGEPANKRRVDFLAVYCFAQFAMTSAN